jgi:hypothetical protein
MISSVAKWQRRSLAIMKEVGDMRVRLVDELNQTIDKIASLRYEVLRGVHDVQTEIHELESELYFAVLKSYHLTHAIRKAKKTPKKQMFVKSMIRISVIEIGLVTAFLLLQIVREHCRPIRTGW